MASLPFFSLLLTLLLPILTFPPIASASVCNTNQNPYCRGNSRFESICCNYPDVCYWSDRYQTPACCPAGQSCQDGYQSPTTIYNGPVYGTLTTTLNGGQVNTAPAQAGQTIVVVSEGTQGRSPGTLMCVGSAVAVLTWFSV